MNAIDKARLDGWMRGWITGYDAGSKDLARETPLELGRPIRSSALAAASTSEEDFKAHRGQVKRDHNKRVRQQEKARVGFEDYRSGWPHKV